jgi:phosphotransferase system enzyme I (PtsP)
MVSARMPTASEQMALYRTVFDAMNGKPVTFRTLDIGGDKILPYLRTAEEENPALGWRAIRIGLDRPGLLRAQLRAMLKAAAGRNLRVMFPMVATVDEFDRAKNLVEREKAYLARHGYQLPDNVTLGVMVEVPSLLFEIDELAARADFLSVGSNDLMQFLFAADRENPLMTARFDALSPACLRALKLVADAGAKAGIPVTLCGELGGMPLEAMALIGLGYRILSMSAASIGPVKAMLLELEADAIKTRMNELLAEQAGAATLRPMIADFAQRHGIPV